MTRYMLIDTYPSARGIPTREKQIKMRPRLTKLYKGLFLKQSGIHRTDKQQLGRVILVGETGRVGIMEWTKVNFMRKPSSWKEQVSQLSLEKFARVGVRRLKKICIFVSHLERAIDVYQSKKTAWREIGSSYSLIKIFKSIERNRFPV